MDGLAIRMNIGLALWDPRASHLVIVALRFCGVKVDNELARVYVVIQSINYRFFLIGSLLEMAQQIKRSA